MTFDRLFLLLIVFSLIACNRPQGISDTVLNLSEESIAPFKDAIGQFDRKAANFPPLPTSGSLKIETVDHENWHMEYPPPPYDVMLHFTDNAQGFRYTYCTVAFRKVTGKLVWIGEQHLFHGPKEYQTDDVMVHESVTITRGAEQIAFAGTDLAGTDIQYSGSISRELTPGDANRILTDWGYLSPDPAVPPK